MTDAYARRRVEETAAALDRLNASNARRMRELSVELTRSAASDQRTARFNHCLRFVQELLHADGGHLFDVPGFDPRAMADAMVSYVEGLETERG